MPTSTQGCATVYPLAQALQKLFALVYANALPPTAGPASFLPSVSRSSASLGGREYHTCSVLLFLNACATLDPWSPKPRLGHIKAGNRRKCVHFDVQTTIFRASIPLSDACDFAMTSILRMRLLARFSLNVICKMAESIGFPEI
jgi:hypothetical protein